MNIEILKEHINTFNNEVLESGFKRDLDDFITSLPAAQNSILAMRDIAKNVVLALDNLYAGDLPDALNILLQRGDNKPFTAHPYNIDLKDLLENKEIQQSAFFNQLNKFLNQLKNQLQQNNNEIEKIEEFIAPYISKEEKRIAKEKYAIMAIIFKDSNTISNLTKFTKSLSEWNRVLRIYHQLIKGDESPEDIEIIEIQNGSIDFIINFNVDVAVLLTNLFEIGFKAFTVYLLHKNLRKDCIDLYNGNKKLISIEGELEKQLLKNIGTAIDEEINIQHKAAKKRDKKIKIESISMKIKQVKNLVVSHIVKGNDLKLLSVPKTGDDQEKIQKYIDKKNELYKHSLAARKALKNIPSEYRQLLLDMYGNNEIENNNEIKKKTIKKRVKKQSSKV